MSALTETQLEYRAYLKSDHWRWLRLEAFRKHGRKCYQCPKTFGLDVHHLRYRYPWTACTVDDVRPCCRGCHEKEHGIVKVLSQPEKKKVQRRRFPQKLTAIWRNTRSGHSLSDKNRKFVHSQLMSGTPDERRIANEIFQKNAACTKKRKAIGARKIPFHQLPKEQRKSLIARYKYAVAFKVRW